MSILAYLYVICILMRCFIFHQRDIKWWKAIIPGYNKYLLGKLACSKKLGVSTAILMVVWWIGIIGVYTFEAWLIQTYATQAIFDSSGSGQVILIIPDNLRMWILIAKYAMIAISVMCIVSWSWMMMKFSQMHKKSNWWIILWALVPFIPYGYFAFKKDIAMYGKRYTLKKVQFK